MNKLIYGVITTTIVFFVLYCLLSWDTYHWNTELEDRTIEDKLMNRFYFSCITTSTVGFGDITPVSKISQLLVCIHTLFITMELVSLLV
jgi:hypothetical protein